MECIIITIGNEILSGMFFQRQIEKKCFLPSNPFAAPMQKVTDFLKNQSTKHKINTSFLPDIYLSNLNYVYPNDIIKALKAGLSVFEKKAPGFIANGVFLAPETRTSSPVRIIRNNLNLCSLSATNLFPCGEGAGYAGGIMSSAADGLKVGSIFNI